MEPDDPIASALKARNGGLLAISSLHNGVEVTSLDDLMQALDQLEELAESGTFGQMIELRVDIDEVLTVSIGYPCDEWALWYDNSVSGVDTYSLNGSGDETEVGLRWGENWEEMEAQCFIDRTLARQAVLHFYRTRTLSNDVTWS